MGGIEPARHPDDEVLSRRGREPLGEALHLDVERLVAIMIELLWAVRHIREAADAALEVDVLEGGLVLECDATERQLRMPHRRGIVVDRPHPHTFSTEKRRVGREGVNTCQY